jgi:hypothetical protein
MEMRAVIETYEIDFIDSKVESGARIMMARRYNMNLWFNS